MSIAVQIAVYVNKFHYIQLSIGQKPSCLCIFYHASSIDLKPQEMNLLEIIMLYIVLSSIKLLKIIDWLFFLIPFPWLKFVYTREMAIDLFFVLWLMKYIYPGYRVCYS